MTTTTPRRPPPPNGIKPLDTPAHSEFIDRHPGVPDDALVLAALAIAEIRDELRRRDAQRQRATDPAFAAPGRRPEVEGGSH